MKGVNYSSKTDDWKTFEKNNLAIALNILYIKEKDIYPSSISKHNSTREKKIILLIIPNKEKEEWHYLVIKKLSAWLPRITSKNKGGCLNCIHSYRTGNKLKSHEKKYKIKIFVELLCHHKRIIY